jgi:hypothetical protein
VALQLQCGQPQAVRKLPRSAQQELAWALLLCGTSPSCQRTVRSDPSCRQRKQQQNSVTVLVLQEVLSAGQGWLHRAAESGQLVFDRVRHADVLEYLWWLTRYARIYSYSYSSWGYSPYLGTSQRASG